MSATSDHIIGGKKKEGTFHEYVLQTIAAGLGPSLVFSAGAVKGSGGLFRTSLASLEEQTMVRSDGSTCGDLPHVEWGGQKFNRRGGSTELMGTAETMPRGVVQQERHHFRDLLLIVAYCARYKSMYHNTIWPCSMSTPAAICIQKRRCICLETRTSRHCSDCRGPHFEIGLHFLLHILHAV